MAHTTLRSSYSDLADRLNRFPQGAPPSDLLFKILSMLFSEEEAGLVSLMPIKPFTARKASRIWKKSLTETQNMLDALADRAILVDFEQNGETTYALPPPMAGFFEFSLMRVRDDIDQKVLSELFHEYMNVEEDFIRELFTRGETQLGRAFVQEPALSGQNALHVLLLPAQDGTHGQGLCCAARHLHDLQYHRVLADETRRCARDRQAGMS